MPQDFAVGGGAEQGSHPFQPDFQFFGVDDVPVVDDGEIMVAPVEDEGLDVVQLSAAGGPVPDVADGAAAGMLPVRVHRKDVGDEAQPFPDGDSARALQRGHPAAFLPPVLQGAQADEHVRRRLVGIKDAEYAAFFVEGAEVHFPTGF